MHAPFALRAISLILLCGAAFGAPSGARAQDGELCRAAIAATERANFIPDRLMHAIAVMESGRRGANGVATPWPWTINVEGVGEVFETKAAAVAAVQAHQARGARSIDVGCMQVNLLHHRAAFPTLEQAFDPPTNVRYAASFLQQLLNQTGSWPRAVAGYHSLTPEIGGEYAKKVMAIWARPDQPRQAAVPAASPAGAAMPSTLPAAGNAALAALPAAAPARMIGNGSAAPSGQTGRGLDSYRAVPTRMAAGLLFRRS